MFLLRLVVEIVSISTDVTLSIIYVICHLGLTVVNFNAFNDISALLGVFPQKLKKKTNGRTGGASTSRGFVIIRSGLCRFVIAQLDFTILPL